MLAVGVRFGLIFCAALALLPGQPPIAGRAGLIYYAEGDLRLNDRHLERFIPMVRVRSGDRLRVVDGRAEVLLQPGNFLRMAEGSEFEMRSDALSHVDLVFHGIAILDIGAASSVQAWCGGFVSKILKPGTYRFECGVDQRTDSLIVRQGHARVAGHERSIDVGGNYVLILNAAMKAVPVRGRSLDSFDEWNAARASLLAPYRRERKIMERQSPPAGVIVIPRDPYPSPN